MKRLMVTGGSGFLGTYFIKEALRGGHHVINVDRASPDEAHLDEYRETGRYEEEQADLCELDHLPVSLDAVVNFAAEAHDDNMVLANRGFFYSNVRGVHRLLELVRSKEATDRPALVQVSATEVYGPRAEGASRETDPLHPANTYAASKAAADQLTIGWAHTYGLAATICRICHVYGLGQHPEKVLPKTMLYLSRGRKMTIHGDGSHRRQWLYAGDAAAAIMRLIERENRDRIYNIVSDEEYSILEVASMAARGMGRDPEQCFQFVAPRTPSAPRFAADGQAIRALGWSPRMTLPAFLPDYIRRLL